MVQLLFLYQAISDKRLINGFANYLSHVILTSPNFTNWNISWSWSNFEYCGWSEHESYFVLQWTYLAQLSQRKIFAFSTIRSTPYLDALCKVTVSWKREEQLASMKSLPILIEYMYELQMFWQSSWDIGKYLSQYTATAHHWLVWQNNQSNHCNSAIINKCNQYKGRIQLVDILIFDYRIRLK